MMHWPVTAATALITQFDADLARMEQGMNACARLALALSPPPPARDLASTALEILAGDVDALAVYIADGDHQWNLIAAAGWLGEAPSTIRLGKAYALDPDGVTCVGPHAVLFGSVRPAWLANTINGLSALSFDRVTVLFGFDGARARCQIHSLILRVAARRLCDCVMAGCRGERDSVTGMSKSAPAIKILLIDDDPALVYYIGRILRDFDLHSAQSAAAGLALARELAPDIMLVDQQMPGGRGIDVLRSVRADPGLRAVPLIMLSAVDEESARLQALAAGADDYILKPFSPRELTARILSNVNMLRLRYAISWRQNELLRLAQAKLDLQRMLDTVEQVRIDERRVLAREVHDQLGQALTVAKIDISLLARRARRSESMTGVDVGTAVTSALRSVEMALLSVQDISRLLRPPELLQMGLGECLRVHLAEVQNRSHLMCKLDWHALERINISAFVAGELYRLCLEALSNVVRHAVARSVTVTLANRGSFLLMRIRDDGRGIEPARLTASDAIGILGMRERANSIRATMQVWGRPGWGTVVSVRLPSKH